MPPEKIPPGKKASCIFCDQKKPSLMLQMEVEYKVSCLKLYKELQWTHLCINNPAFLFGTGSNNRYIFRWPMYPYITSGLVLCHKIPQLAS